MWAAYTTLSLVQGKLMKYDLNCETKKTTQPRKLSLTPHYSKHISRVEHRILLQENLKPKTDNTPNYYAMSKNAMHQTRRTDARHAT
jgi:hypothetical protein